MTGAEQYAAWVLDEKNARETGRYIKLACKRFLSDLKRKDIYFDTRECSVMVDFCEHFLYQWEGDWEGQPLNFELWQKFIFEQVYGWIRVDTGTRRFTEVFVEIAKKNGKSTMCAGLANFHLFGDEKVKTPKIFTAANNEEQARICVNMAGRIIEISPVFEDMLATRLVGLMHYKENITEVINYENKGFIKALTKETGDKTAKTYGGKHGVNASLGIVDEFGMSVDHGASGTIKTSMSSRRERLMFYITTAGFNLQGPCYRELRKTGIDVLEGTVVKDNYLPMLFEIDPPVDEKGKPNEITMQWLAENEWAWKQCNPNLDVSVSREFLREQIQDAITYGGTKEVEIKTLNFNLWVDSPDTFIPADVWNKNVHGLEIPEGADCFGGLEIGNSGEVSALCLLFPMGDIVAVKMTFWIASEALKTRDFYRDNKDFLLIDEGNEVDNDVAFRWVTEEIGKYNMHSFCFPNTMKNNSLVQMLIKEGYEGNPISQGVIGVGDPTSEWEKLLRAGKVEHFGNPILAWMNSNCIAFRKEQGIRIEKSQNVLGIYACINAIAQWKTISAEQTEADTNFFEL